MTEVIGRITLTQQLWGCRDYRRLPRLEHMRSTASPRQSALPVVAGSPRQCRAPGADTAVLTTGAHCLFHSSHLLTLNSR